MNDKNDNKKTGGRNADSAAQSNGSSKNSEIDAAKKNKDNGDKSGPTKQDRPVESKEILFGKIPNGSTITQGGESFTKVKPNKKGQNVVHSEKRDINDNPVFGYYTDTTGFLRKNVAIAGK